MSNAEMLHQRKFSWGNVGVTPARPHAHMSWFNRLLIVGWMLSLAFSCSRATEDTGGSTVAVEKQHANATPNVIRITTGNVQVGRQITIHWPDGGGC